MASVLPESLDKPAPGKPTKTVIDWNETPLSEYDGAYAVILDGLFSEYECNKLVEAAMAQNNLAAGDAWERAMINVGNYQQAMASHVRNSGRLIFDDADVAAKIWARVAPYVPELDREPVKNQPDVNGKGPVMRGEVYRFSCLNERLRFLQYGPGEYFRPHCDGCFVRPEGDNPERSFYTLHLYLNEASPPDNDLVGGATSFHKLYSFADFIDEDEEDDDSEEDSPFSSSLDGQRRIGNAKDVHVVPKIGRVLIFRQRDIEHSGQKVYKGLKLTMRTDLMFKKTDEEVPKSERVIAIEQMGGQNFKSAEKSSSVGPEAKKTHY